MPGQSGSTMSPGFGSLTPSFPSAFFSGLHLPVSSSTKKETHFCSSKMDPCNWNMCPSWTVVKGMKTLLDSLKSVPTPEIRRLEQHYLNFIDCAGGRLCSIQNQKLLLGVWRLSWQKQATPISNKDKESSIGRDITWGNELNLKSPLSIAEIITYD